MVVRIDESGRLAAILKPRRGLPPAFWSAPTKTAKRSTRCRGNLLSRCGSKPLF